MTEKKEPRASDSPVPEQSLAGVFTKAFEEMARQLSENAASHTAILNSTTAEYQHAVEQLTKSLAGTWPPNDPMPLGLLQPASGLQSEIARLRSEIDATATALLREKTSAREKEKQLLALQAYLRELKAKEDLAHLLSRVAGAAQAKILQDPTFRAKFSEEAPCDAFVLSIDIRRSTELMLKAREPKLYATFITTLAAKLRQCVLDNYGVFDKFTGDGILAFFPIFFSGVDAGFRAVTTAARCHRTFDEHYSTHRHCFLAILKETGLGIGLDYGRVQIVEVGGEVSVVGPPVVYACRMAGAKAGETLVNQPAYEQLLERYAAIFDFKTSEIQIKHDGATLAYSVEVNGKYFLPQQPPWFEGSASLSAGTPPRGQK